MTAAPFDRERFREALHRLFPDGTIVSVEYITSSPTLIDLAVIHLTIGGKPAHVAKTLCGKSYDEMAMAVFRKATKYRLTGDRT